MASDGPARVVRTTDLRKEYGSTVAVDDVSIEILANEIFGLLGPNGAGKTTAIEILQGLRTPTSGDAEVLGLDLQTDLYEIKDRIGVVPQSFHTFERLTVRENVALVRDLHSEPLDVDAVLEKLDLAEWASDPFHTLSGGYQRRTGIAMALVSDPEILFLDEPTTGLDPAARRSTWEQIEQLPELGTTVVLTTHDMAEVEYLADRVALLVDGHVEAVDSVAGLIEAYAGEVTVVVHLDESNPSGEADSLERVLEESAQTVHRSGTGELIGVFEDRQRAQDTYSTLQDAGTGHAIDLVSPGMEDVFLELAGKTLTPAGGLQ
ncbi:ABC transporter ATP-binding protein [Halobacterium bonnevillei]|uniref:ATP-binding cassette domain-containing protein n=1 Tax=Halobacterium bonnevillei TaxID=2692200 RepID=A0A6B0SI06_9EURY|nr:ABC transporter ATP-binding protein [Halobacterium bonnevillei]MXR21404.1 ATP-binding cassette domain-containing protein [Halobacterium bonnevillei]